MDGAMQRCNGRTGADDDGDDDDVRVISQTTSKWLGSGECADSFRKEWDAVASSAVGFINTVER